MNRNHSVITFKADASLAKLLQGVSNRSEFIRSAVLAALDNACPFCKGTGVLNPHKKQHLEAVASSFQEQDCKECDDVIMTRQKGSK